MKKITLLSVAASMLLSSAIGVSAAEKIMPNEDGSYTVNAEVAGVAAGSMYGILAVKGDAAVDTITEADIMYIDQITATEAGKISLAKFGLLEATESTLYVGGAGLDGATEIAVLGVKVEVKGNKISGQVTSYNPNNATTVTLYQNGEATAYTATIAAVEGSGQVTQNFEIADVPAGTYDLVVTKAQHLTYKVTGVVVEGADIDLSAAEDKEYQNMTMLCGALDNNELINYDDLFIVLDASTYGLSVEEAASPEADLDGNALVQYDDLFIVLDAKNYGMGADACTFEY